MALLRIIAVSLLCLGCVETDLSDTTPDAGPGQPLSCGEAARFVVSTCKFLPESDFGALLSTCEAGQFEPWTGCVRMFEADCETVRTCAEALLFDSGVIDTGGGNEPDAGGIAPDGGAPCAEAIDCAAGETCTDDRCVPR